MSKKQSYNLKFMVDNMIKKIMIAINASLSPLIDFISTSVRSRGLSSEEIIIYNDGMQKIADLLNNGIGNGYFSNSGSDNIIQLNKVISCDSETIIDYITLYSLNADQLLFTFTIEPVTALVKIIPTKPFDNNNVPSIDFLSVFHIFNNDCQSSI